MRSGAPTVTMLFPYNRWSIVNHEQRTITMRSLVIPFFVGTTLVACSPVKSDEGVCGDGVIEADEVCDPGIDLCCNATCDGALGAATVCRADNGMGCDVAETCDGSSYACPADALAAAST
jgi:hypothetical protein